MYQWFRKYRLLAVVLMLATVQAYAQQAAQPAPKPAQQPRRFLMWKVTSPTATVYLVGSMHLMAKDAYPLPQAVETAFSNSKVLAVEIDMKHADPAKMGALVQQYGLYGPEDTLLKHISGETSAALDEFCAKYGVPRENLEHLKPWMVGTLVALLPMQKAGADPQGGIDMHFMTEAQSQRIDELETAEFQFGLLASGTDQEHDASLLYSLKNAETKTRQLEAAYLAGDVDAMMKLVSDNPFPENTKRMIDDRNPGMASKVEAYLKGNDTAFVVVGAAHVIGDKGIAKILEDKKYKVERMTLDW